MNFTSAAMLKSKCNSIDAKFAWPSCEIAHQCVVIVGGGGCGGGWVLFCFVFCFVLPDWLVG